MLGHQQMARWIQLALFGANGRTLDNPLLEAAAVRATFMNQLAHRHPTLGRVRDSPDEAFLVGIFSLLDTIHAVEMQDLVGVIDEALGQVLALRMTRAQVLEARWMAFGWRASSLPFLGAG